VFSGLGVRMCLGKSCLSGESGCVVVEVGGRGKKKEEAAQVKVNLGWGNSPLSLHRQAPHHRQSQVTGSDSSRALRHLNNSFTCHLKFTIQDSVPPIIRSDSIFRTPNKVDLAAATTTDAASTRLHVLFKYQGYI
jgi:hypothetical protein